MSQHTFIFTPGLWIGEGKITFSASPEHLRFFTKWQCNPLKNGLIDCRQIVEMQDRAENVANAFTFSEISPTGFKAKLVSDMIGAEHGKGIIDQKTIAWEFRGNPDFEGFEVYELQENGDYMLHAEYTSSEHFRTIIEGRLWKKTAQEPLPF
jgi:hypothetical protein